MMFQKLWEKQMKMKTGLKYKLVQKVRKRRTNYSMVFRQGDKLKVKSATVPGAHILDVLETNMVLNGWWTLPQNITGKSN